ncbi:MAG: hypothetical protein CMH61_02940 [Nanoarchaeota archaeon]|nr:hypothetical protein [Nanoarchaeota archaeon]
MWHKKKINEKCVDEVFQIDGIPLWWFFDRLKDVKFIPSFPGFRHYIHYSELLKRNIVGKWVKKKEGKKIIFLSYTNHFRNGKHFRIQHLLDGMKGEISPLVLTAYPFSKMSLYDLRYGDHPFRYWTQKIENQAKKNALKFSKKWKKVRKHIKYPSEVDTFFSYELLLLMFRYYFVYKKIISEEEVRAVYTTAISSLFEKCLLGAASTCQVRSFMGQHGIGAEFWNNTTNHLHSHHFLVMGKKYKEELVSRGFENVHVTGPQIFEELVPFINGTKKKDHVLFMTTPFVEDKTLSKEEYFRKVKVIMEQLKKLNQKLIIKLHPREQTMSEYQKIASDLQLDVAVLSESTREKHYQLLANCSVLINFGSTVALEAMLLGKPTITIDPFDGVNPINPFIRESDATVKLKWDGGIEEKVIELLDKPELLSKEVKKFIDNHAYKVDGKVTERVLQIIKEMTH